MSVDVAVYIYCRITENTTSDYIMQFIYLFCQFQLKKERKLAKERKEAVRAATYRVNNSLTLAPPTECKRVMCTTVVVA